MQKEFKQIANKLDTAFSKLHNYDVVDEVLEDMGLWDLYSAWVEKKYAESWPLTLAESEALLNGFKECRKAQNWE